ncbi:hypothetical protein ILUMI_05934 [Ignelater luminosus]|uniref:Fucosyltransferase n=1 Tax=Ignelater luminosus TaxID=2038154 RepID=A0A8K0DGN9_IGNLU|nr:hypothetical protein ILUMI_05934 [Ignelater luminosus]
MSTIQILFKAFLSVVFCGTIIFLTLFMNQRHSLPYLFLLGNTTANKSKQKPWYFKNGAAFPHPSNETPRLFPEQMEGDRITEQLMYLPENYSDANTSRKVILAVEGLQAWHQNAGSVAFQGCPASRCMLTENEDEKTFKKADAVLFQHTSYPSAAYRPPEQVWILYLLECPYYTFIYEHGNVFNWTATYRWDSDLVTPYEKWVYYDPKVTQKRQERNYAANKTKKVAWFVSNCFARNNRLKYAQELQNYISLDIYGACGTLTCSRQDPRCFQLLDRDYKFYLAFENSNCGGYITEKFYVNGLQYNVIPIVMGARREDYRKSAPLGSYIHVDDFSSPQKLAEYLHVLDKNDELYNTYFRWKGTGEFINTYFWCRLCGMLHAPLQHKHYEDVNGWWHREGICTGNLLRNNTR